MVAAGALAPLLTNAYYSSLDWTLGAPTAVQVGLANYAAFFAAPDTPQILTTTAVFTVATVGGSMILGLLVALALNRRVRGAGVHC